jgi:hypothetical protein
MMKMSMLMVVGGALAMGGAHGADRSKELIQDDVLAGFRPVKVWNGVAEAKAVPGKKDFALSGKGAILVNITDKEKRAPYLLTKDEFQDVEVHLEFMVPKESNAGIYLMGRYEIQILDSFGKEKVGPGDLGGLYQRWDPKRKDGAGFEGVPPRTNAAKAPGEWQTMDIVFRAPRFDAAGQKTEHAKFVSVKVNGQVMHKNQEAKGPTRAHPLKGEVAEGPIAIQGDHGPIAIRSFKVTRLQLP